MKPCFSGEDVVWCLSETLDDSSLETLMRSGLSTRFPKEHDIWKRQRNEIGQRFRRALAQRQEGPHVKVKSEEDKELAILRSGFVRQIEESSRKHSRSYVPHTFGLRPITQHNIGERLFMSTASKQRRRATSPRVRYLTLSYQEYISFPLPDSYFVSGRRESLQNQEIEYHVHRLSLLAHQRHNLQLDTSYVPTPVLNKRFSQSFRISSEIIVR